MDEQKTTQEAKQTNPVDNSQRGTETEKPLSIVDEAKKVRDEIRAENDRREKILTDEQKLQAERELAGTAGGRVEPKPVQEETPSEYSKRVMSGGLNEKAREE